MDMIFSEPTSLNQDSALAESLSGLNSSVCGFFLRDKSTQNITNEELEILGDSSLDLLQSQISQFKNPLFVSAPFAEMNILPILESCSLSGSFSTLSESDHLMRSYPIAKPEYFKGKIVILGITEVGAGDVVSTPMGSMPGPLLHYTFISNLLENHLIKEPKNITSVLIVFMVLLPFILVLLFKKILHRVVINIVIYLIIYAYIRYLFVTEMIYIDLFYPLISLVLSF